MLTTMVHILKAVLILFCSCLACKQQKAGNSTVRNYWIVVALYWTFNLLSGLLE